MSRAPKQLDPLIDVLPTPSEATSLQALYLGTAREDQQKKALDFILQKACRAFSTTFDADPQVSAFMQGRRQAGLIIMNATRTTAKAAEVLEDNQKKD